MFKLISCICILIFSFNVFARPAKNSKAPEFKLNEIVTGEKFNLSKYKNKIVVLEWHNPTCPFTSRHAKEMVMVDLYEKYKNKNVAWLGIDSTNPKYSFPKTEYMMWKTKYFIGYPILEDLTGEVGKKYSAKMTPHMVIINKGKVVYQGAIDDDIFGDKKKSKRKNYVEIALRSLTKNGKLPRRFKSYVPAYGCGIKY